MPYTPFTFVNKLQQGLDLGLSISPIRGPDGTKAGAPTPGNVLGSTIVGKAFDMVPPTEPSWMHVALLVDNQIGWGVALPGSNRLFANDVSPSYALGAADGFGTWALEGYVLPLSFTDPGRAYFWSRDPSNGNWTQAQRIDGTVAGGAFGATGAIYGNWAAIGATTVNSNKGQVQIFNLQAGVWVQTQVLAPSDLSAGDQFGAPSMIGNFLFIATTGQNSNAGAVYVYELSGGTWTQTQKLTGTGTAGFLFGFSVACDGTTLAIGEIGNGAGVVYIYTLVGGAWTQQTTLTAGAAGDQFGNGVAVSNSLLAVGAPRNNGFKGIVYVYSGAGASWTLEQSITAFDGFANQQFGFSVGIYYNPAQTSSLLVGAPDFAVSGGGGAFYAYESTQMPTTPPGSQLAFYGVRRIQGGASSDPAPSGYPYYEKSFKIPISFQITTAYNPSSPPQLTAVSGCAVNGLRVSTAITDYDFELRHMIKYVVDANGNPLTSPSPFSVILYDSTYVARSNIPVLAEFLFDDLNTPGVGRNFWPSPPILYKVNSVIPLDIFSLVDSTVTLPVTVNLLFDGARRIPCL